jgi:hypothetical protein
MAPSSLFLKDNRRCRAKLPNLQQRDASNHPQLPALVYRAARNATDSWGVLGSQGFRIFYNYKGFDSLPSSLGRSPVLVQLSNYVQARQIKLYRCSYLLQIGSRHFAVYKIVFTDADLTETWTSWPIDTARACYRSSLVRYRTRDRAWPCRQPFIDELDLGIA